MVSTLELVRFWEETFGKVIPRKPGLADARTNALRIELLREELQELTEAVEAGDLVEMLDALTDLQWVLDGAYLAWGLDGLKQAAFDEVFDSNMSKLGADGEVLRREDGKILKGPNYVPPNLKRLFDQET